MYSYYYSLKFRVKYTILLHFVHRSIDTTCTYNTEWKCDKLQSLTERIMFLTNYAHTKIRVWVLKIYKGY